MSASSVSASGASGARAFVVREDGGRARASFETVEASDLGPGDVTVRVEYTAVNFKDTLTLEPARRVAKRYPLVPGVDLSGEVIESKVDWIRPGAQVIAQGPGLGTSHHGGFSSLARVPAAWIFQMPAGLEARSAMLLGTPGLTAQMVIDRLAREGVEPAAGPVVVTGASGGVGSFVVAVLAEAGYEVSASSRDHGADAYLRRLGAVDVLSPAELVDPHQGRLGHGRWAAAVDMVGGDTLAELLRTTRGGGVIAVVGHVGAADLQTTVYPWIVRGVVAAGIDTEHLAAERRATAWRALAAAYRRGAFGDVAAEEIPLEELPAALARVRAGETVGRVVVRVS